MLYCWFRFIRHLLSISRRFIRCRGHTSLPCMSIVSTVVAIVRERFVLHPLRMVFHTDLQYQRLSQIETHCQPSKLTYRPVFSVIINLDNPSNRFTNGLQNTLLIHATRKANPNHQRRREHLRCRERRSP
ncbi:hypothetical protein ES332_D13G071600v1 [Gossypium tomentosum]|uniref:Uncharacterized protein n=1 Tax=Gossypium tomentosum TaxID=34277 RepID=A0A5D2HVP7_GOSTO|nr:hypothetical protein ES332_D13G071600v1 [Gossypium tomentosum]